MSEENTLVTQNISKSYKGRKVVKSVSLEVSSGEIVGLLGPNGAGKTTSFYMTLGLVHPDKGSVFYKGKEITNLSMSERAKRGVSYLPQEASVFRTMTVEENIWVALEASELPRSDWETRLKQTRS